MRNENNTHVVLTEDFRTRETKQCLEAIRGLQTVIWVAEGHGIPITVGRNGRPKDA